MLPSHIIWNVIAAWRSAFIANCSALNQIQDNYERWPTYLYGTRRYLLKRFPFVIVYRAAESRIEIIAVAHGRRRPGYWAARLH